MDIYMILLRIVHIFAGVFWVGAAIINIAFLIPAARSSGPEGQKFMQTLMGGPYSTALYNAGGLTMLAGILLYWRDSGGFQISWITSPVGLGFTIGALAAVASSLLGAIVLGPATRQFGALRATIQAEGKSPSISQQAEMTRLNARVIRAGRINAILLGLALLCMATARYW